MVTQCVEDGSIDVQVRRLFAPVVKTVVDNGSNHMAFRCACSFFLDEGCHGQQLPQIQLIFCDIGFIMTVLDHQIGVALVQGRKSIIKFLGEAVVEAVQHFFQSLPGGAVFIEVIGVGEEEAFQTVLITTLDPFQEPVFVQFTGCGPGFQIGNLADALGFQKSENLTAAVTFRNQHIFDNHSVAGTGTHLVHQCMVVIDGVQCERAGGDLFFCFRQICIQKEQLRIPNQTGLMKLVSDGFHGIFCGDGNGYDLFLSAKGQYIRCTDPQETSHGHTNGQNQQQPYHGSQHMGDTQKTCTFLPLGPAFADGPFRFDRGLLPDILVICELNIKFLGLIGGRFDGLRYGYLFSFGGNRDVLRIVDRQIQLCCVNIDAIGFFKIFRQVFVQFKFQFFIECIAGCGDLCRKGIDQSVIIHIGIG